MRPILIVDDNEQNLYLLHRLLSSKGFEVITAVNGAEALEKARHNPPAMIISDILMQVMDGFELCRQWKQDEQLKVIPFVFYTATYTSSEDEKFALSLGADRFILKPQEPTVFLQKIEEVLAAYQTGELTAQPPPQRQEQETFRQYSETLFRKMEQKIAELEKVKRRLEEEIAERRRGEEELRRLEQQLYQAAKMEAIGRLAGGIAHDFNNALTPILALSDLLLHQLTPDHPFSPDLREIKEMAERCASLTRQLLTFSRRQPMKLTILNLNDVILNLKKMLTRIIGEDILLITRLEPELASVRGDVAWMEQILLNLAVNARDAMRGGGTLTIETRNVIIENQYAAEHPGVRPGFYVLLAVTDTGLGMDAETREHIFEPFFTTKEGELGTGLGLATVYGIVTQSGGHITVESKPGQGTTFKIFLPRAEKEGEEKAAPAACQASAEPPLETILLVEDNESVRKTTARLLSRHGYTVLEAGTEKEALDICTRHSGPLHLIISDVVMPGRSGPEIVARLLSLWPQVKILFVSGYPDETILRYGLVGQETNFLPKPFTEEVLLAKVREVLRSPASFPSSFAGLHQKD